MTTATTTLTTPIARQFTSDNRSGICPEAWRAMAGANAGHVPSYGDDDWTRRASDLLREAFGADCDVYFVFNGTAANSLALASLCQSYHSVVCHETSHVETDECGAPEFFSNGTKLLLAPGTDGKLAPSEVEALVLPRVFATVLMMPLLSFYAALIAIFGGLIFVWVSLGIPPVTFIQRTREVVPMTDLWQMLIKAPVFGLIIAMAGCFQGLQVEGNAESLGLRTTAAVVQAIFLVVVLDAFFAVFFTSIGWL